MRNYVVTYIHLFGLHTAVKCEHNKSNSVHKTETLVTHFTNLPLYLRHRNGMVSFSLFIYFLRLRKKQRTHVFEALRQELLLTFLLWDK